MSRYIDADALIDKLMNAIECGHRTDMPTQELEAVLSDVRNAPTIDIVRCKECRHRSYCYSEVHMTNKKQTTSICKDIDFCSYGERKESER